MKKVLIFGALLLAGCGPVKTTVYGKSGQPYTAPDLCAALLQCQKAGESACEYYDSVLVIDDKTQAQSECKVVQSRP